MQELRIYKQIINPDKCRPIIEWPNERTYQCFKLYTNAKSYFSRTPYIYLFIYCHLYSALSIVQCSNALYRLRDGDIQGHTGQPSVREIDAYTMYNSMSNRSWPKPQLS